MYEGAVIKSFVDKRTRKVHLVRTVYRSDDLERMRELAQLGRIAFEEPPAPEEKGQAETPNTAGDAVTAQQGDGQGLPPAVEPQEEQAVGEPGEAEQKEPGEPKTEAEEPKKKRGRKGE